MVAIAAAVLVTFIGGLYFITHHKKEESETLQSQKVTIAGETAGRFRCFFREVLFFRREGAGWLRRT